MGKLQVLEAWKHFLSDASQAMLALEANPEDDEAASVVRGRGDWGGGLMPVAVHALGTDEASAGGWRGVQGARGQGTRCRVGSEGETASVLRGVGG